MAGPFKPYPMSALNQLLENWAFEMKSNILIMQLLECKWYQFKKQKQIHKQIKLLIQKYSS